MFSFKLDNFQEIAIESIKNGKHVLVTAHTGSGKTVPAEFAIHYFCSQQKQVIYTSPIKSLSNQKFYEMSNRFPEISFGILTGDIKFNPNAQCLIVTTEILRNSLYNKHNDIDISQLSCVIFDEIHYINDTYRGKVWEETIMLLPKHVQMVMLSATIQNPQYFADWIQKIKNVDVVLSGTNKRVVPLTHYSYYCMPESYKHDIFTKEHEHLQKYESTLLPIKTPNSSYKQPIIDKVNKIRNLQQKYIKPQFVLNNIINKLKHEEKLPAICFVFSRKKAEQYAHMIESNLHDIDDTKKTTNVYKECEYLIRNKLQNHNEYTSSFEFTNTLKLLQKGIAVHHSGIIPVIREMIELLFSKGYIKLLFATETFSVGINMPTKTVLFTSLTKFDGNSERYLYPHEYTQMAGRAGRRGLDNVGHVIHLHSMFEPLQHKDYSILLSGKAQNIQSRLNIDFSYVLRNISHEKDIYEQLQNSMMFQNINEQIKRLYEKLQSDKNRIYIDDKVNYLINRYIELVDLTSYTKIKKSQQKKIENTKKELIDEISTFGDISQLMEEYQKQKDNECIENEISTLENVLSTNIENIISIFITHGFIVNDILTKKGIIASNIQETNCLVLSECYTNGYLHSLTINEMIQFLSCFTDIRIPEQNRNYVYDGNSKKLQFILHFIENKFNKYYNIESKEIGYINEDDYFYQYDLIEIIEKWIHAKTEIETKNIIIEANELGIFAGEFVKAILKINAIALELENICDTFNDLALKSILHSIPEKTLKYIATNQSLYI